MATVAVSEMRRGCGRRGEGGPAGRALGGGTGCQATGSGAEAGAATGAAMTGGLAWPGFSGAMPGRATPSTVFCAEARRGWPPTALGGGSTSGPGGGGGDG